MKNITLTIPVQHLELARVIMVLVQLFNQEEEDYHFDSDDPDISYWDSDLPDALRRIIQEVRMNSVDLFQLRPGDLSSDEWILLARSCENIAEIIRKQRALLDQGKQE